MRLLLIRHAKPLTEGRLADPSLDPTGRHQALMLAKQLGTHPISAIHSSPARRALETAQPISERLDIEIQRDNGLVEYNHGADRYVPLEEIRRQNGVRWSRLSRGEFDDPDVDPVEFRNVVVDAVENIVRAHPGMLTVAVVTSAGVINAYVGHVLGIDTPLWFAPGYSSISRVSASRSGGRHVISLNEMCHWQADAELGENREGS